MVFQAAFQMANATQNIENANMKVRDWFMVISLGSPPNMGFLLSYQMGKQTQNTINSIPEIIEDETEPFRGPQIGAISMVFHIDCPMGVSILCGDTYHT